MSNNNISITKMSGETAFFDESKLRHSLVRSGAEAEIVQEVINEINALLYNGISTKEIYRVAFKKLKSRSRTSASKYKLKKAIMELGPSGFPFEKFIGKILDHEGFETQVGVIVQGKCVQHEVDVIAQKDNKHYMIECKFHSDQGRFCNVKIPLYIQSRFLDVMAKWEKQKGHETKFHQGWVTTNTRFTSDAIQYAECAGLKLLSWDYPANNSLKSRIDKAGLHPLTALTTLTKAEKTKLLNEGIVLCKELHQNSKLLNKIGITKTRQNRIISDSIELCKKNK
ncbi:MAG: restriction endonuclease [Vicingaceae bacterium]